MKLVTLFLACTFATFAAAQPRFTEVNLISEAVPSWSVSWVDVDGDDDLDLFVSRFAQTGGNALFLNTGSGFEPAGASALTNGRGSIGHSWADVDNDGDLDVFAAGSNAGFGDTGGASTLYLNDGSGGFSVVVAGVVGRDAGVLGWSAAWGDYDRDGHVDLVVAHPAGYLGSDQPNHLFRNLGDGTFERVVGGPVTSGLAPYTIPTWSDFDLDSDLDLFIGSGPADGSTGRDNLYENRLVESGSASFERITTGVIATDRRDGQVMNWVDVDNDGDLDLYVTSFFGTHNMFYRNDGDAYIRDDDSALALPVGGSSLANAWADVDNDGDLDVVVTVLRNTVQDDGFNRLYVNDGAGGFTQVEAPPLTSTRESTSGATFGDFDNDGDLDLATTTPSNGAVRVYRNDAPGENAWLKLRLIGTSSNRSAIGALVRVEAVIGGRMVRQIRELSAQNTFGGQNSLIAHFGLGDAGQIDVLEVEWPSGARDRFTDLTASQAYTLTEGSAPTPVHVERVDSPRPSRARLHPPIPNPVRDDAVLQYVLPEAGVAHLIVYDALGRFVATLADGYKPAGLHLAVWRPDTPRQRAAGLYLVRLIVNGSPAASTTLVRIP